MEVALEGNTWGPIEIRGANQGGQQINKPGRKQISTEGKSLKGINIARGPKEIVAVKEM